MNKHLRWLHDQLPAWVTQGVITPAQADGIRRLYPEPKQALPWGMLIFSGIGAIVIGLGVVLFRANAAPAIPKPLQQLAQDWNSGFRIEYRPPPPEACATLTNTNLIWHGRLRSRWFNPMGNVD